MKYSTITLFIVVTVIFLYQPVQAAPLNQVQQIVTCTSGTLGYFEARVVFQSWSVSDCGAPVGVPITITVTITRTSAPAAFIYLELNDDAPIVNYVNVTHQTSSVSLVASLVTTDGLINKIHIGGTYQSALYLVEASWQVIPTPTLTPTITPTPTQTPVPTATPWSPSTPVPLPTSTCASCDFYLPLNYQKLEIIIHQNDLLLQKVDTNNFNLSVIHSDLTGLNTTLQDLSSQQQTQHQELLAAIATMDARQYSPPFYTETITTPAGLEVITRYTVTDAGSEAQLQLQIFLFIVWMSWAGYSTFRGRE